MIALGAHAAIAALAVLFVAYTNIDWNAYMEQVHQVFDKGERDYTLVRGDTGPLVYPAGFLGLYGLLSLLPTLRAVQWVFWGLLLCHSAVALLLARRLLQEGGRKGGELGLWQALLLVGSRRVASVFVLRLFNDGPAAVLVLLSLLVGADSSGSLLATLLVSLAVSIKMSALLVLPGLAAVLLRTKGWTGSLVHAALFLGVQVAIGAPFLLSHPTSYLSRAFELSRVFEHRWSVNWAFLDPAIFVSPPFAVSLLVLHVSLLLLFASRRWGGVMNLLAGKRISTSPALALRIQLESIFIGVVCARTLHYQFYAM